jgi:PcRGLX-like N-terminal RIFT barrel domain
MKNFCIFSLCFSLFTVAACGGEIVTLTVVERGGVERKSEPITCGVPFARGLLKDTSRLSLTDASGKAVAASFKAVNFWPGDKSVRWAHLDTLVSVAAGKEVKLSVRAGTPKNPNAKLEVKDGGEFFEVNTGALKFKLRKKGFRLLEEVEVASPAWTKVLDSCGDGLLMKISGKVYNSASDKSSRLIIEDQTPMRVSFLASGRLAGAGRDKYSYQIRVHAYAGSTRVKLQPSITKKYGHPRDMKHYIEDLSIVMNVPAGKSLPYALGGYKTPAGGTLAPGQKANVSVSKSTSWKFGGQASGGGDPKASKPLSLGWGSLGGVAAGVNSFWQTFPKTIELSGDGKLKLGLCTALSGQRLQFFTGMARTHQVMLYFFGNAGKQKAQETQKIFVALQKPLFAAAPSDYYCQKTGVFGPLSSAGTKLAGGATQALATMDANMSKWFARLAGPYRDNWRKRGVTMDTYGFMGFGDTLHYVWNNSKSKGTPWDIAWDSNYYDLAHIGTLNFLRTGKLTFLDWFRDQSWHLMDVDVVHWHPKISKNGGGSRRCPASNHVGYDAPQHMSPIVNIAFDHHKSESLFERFYLLADRRAYKVARELLGHAFNHKNGSYGGTRKPGHQMITLCAGYWDSGDKKYLQRARKVLDDGIPRQKKHDGKFNSKVNFTDGLLLEGITKYFLASGDQEALKCIKVYCDSVMKDGQLRYGNLAIGFALLYRETGEQKYLDTAVQIMNKSKPSHLSKDLGHMYRPVPYLSGLLVPKK